MSLEAAAFRALDSPQAVEILRRRAESLAQVEEERVSNDSTELLMFRLGPEWYAVPIACVREIHHEYRVTPIPCVPDFVLGVINVRGEILSVTDLGALLQVPGRTDVETGGEMPSAIVVATDSCVSALVVDEIGDIVDVADSAIEPPLFTLDKTQAEYMSGSVYAEGLLIGIVNVGKVLEPIGETRDGRA